MLRRASTTLAEPIVPPNRYVGRARRATMATIDMEFEARPGRVVLRFSKDGDTTEYPLSADGADRLADNLQRTAERARNLE